MSLPDRVRSWQRSGKLDEALKQADPEDVETIVTSLLDEIEDSRKHRNYLNGLLGPWRTVYVRWACEQCPGQSQWIRQEFVKDVIDAAEHHHQESPDYYDDPLDMPHRVYIERRSVIMHQAAANVDDPHEMMVLDGGRAYREISFHDEDTLREPTNTELGLDVPQDPIDAGDKTILHGVAASPGTAKGTAVWINPDNDQQPTDDHLPTPFILTAPYTNPSLLPWMEKSNGIVTDRGGMSSHAAHTARELGKPCVSQLFPRRTNTDSIQQWDGHRLRINGDKGQVDVDTR
jgi:phosphohistidine swiveling domain-containing protein